MCGATAATMPSLHIDDESEKHVDDFPISSPCIDDRHMDAPLRRDARPCTWIRRSAVMPVAAHGCAMHVAAPAPATPGRRLLM
jgi:hypothetical protein